MKDPTPPDPAQGLRPEPSEHPDLESSTWGRVQSLFHEALGLDPAGLDAFLSQVAEHDPGIADEVRSLLFAHQESSGFLSAPPVAPFGRGISPGEKLGPYRIVEEIGRGGMGVVYRAVRDDENFTKEVAIKLIDPGMRSDQILRRFRAERQILAMLDHPHIARLIDGGTAPDGSPYLVMEHVSGRPLLEDCDARQLGIDERLTLFLAVCDAVQFAHQRLVVHRDLKSDNILVTEDGSPRLLDFGIAKLLSAEGGPLAATMTAPMNRMLTPDYASPEQIRGEPATMAGDVYSLGVVLYELLTGSRPLRFTTRTPEEILRVMSQEEPVPPSVVVARSTSDETALRRGDTTRRLKSRLSGDLDYVVLKALEKDPSRRYGSVDQLAQDIRRHLNGLPVLARGQSTTYLLSRFVRRHRAAVVTTAIVVLSLIAGLAGTIWQAGVAGRERDLAKRRFDDVRALAHAVMFDIHDAIMNLPGSTKARETLVQHALLYLDRLNQEATGDLSLQRELGIAYAKIGDVQGRPMSPNLGRSSEALVSYNKALGLLGEVSKGWPDSASVAHDLIVVRHRKVDLLSLMGRLKEAMAEAVSTRQRILAELERRPNDRLFLVDLSVAYGRISDMKLAFGDTLGAIEENTRYVNHNERLFRMDPKDMGFRRGVFVALAKMANLRAMRGERDSALANYLRAEAIALEAVAALPNNTEASRDLSICYGLRGMFLADGGDVDSALAVYDLGMKIAEDLAAKDPDNMLQQNDLASGHYEIGTILMKGHRYEAAEREFGEAFERYAHLVAADATNAESRRNQALIGRSAGEACQALARHSHTSTDRSRWRSRALTWLGKSLDLYKALAQEGVLNGDEESAPEQVDRMIAGLRTAG